MNVGSVQKILYFTIKICLVMDFAYLSNNAAENALHKHGMSPVDPGLM